MIISHAYCQDKIIDEVIIQGNQKTKTSFIKKILETQKGKILDSTILNKDIIRLKRLPGISHATYQVIDVKEKKSKIILTIEENFTIIPELNIWTTTNERLAFRVGLYEFNLFGRNIGFGGSYQNNGHDSYAVSFRAPYLFSNKFGLAINYLNWKSEEPLYFDDGVINYLYNNVSYEILGLYELNFKNNIQFGINFFNEKYGFISGDVVVEIPNQLDIDKKLLKFVYNYDNLDYSYQYLEGFKSQLYAQLVISDNNYNQPFYIAWNDFFYFKRVGERGNWANRLRIGLATNDDTPFAPFALDNNINLRGVGIIVDRGTGSIVLNTEYRYTLYEKNWFSLQGNAFIDAGSWRNPGGKLSDFTKNENIQVYSGIGLRLIHKKIYNAVFRIDYGYGLTKGASQGLVFGIGQYF